MTAKCSFNKKERLKSNKDIERVLKSGKTKVFFPLKLFFLPRSQRHATLKLVVLVPKRKISSAVKRNRTRRIIREAWRLNKHKLELKLNGNNTGMDVALLYLEQSPPKYREIYDKTTVLIEYLLSIK